MTLAVAKKIKEGDKVQHRNGLIFTVVEKRVCNSWTTGKTTVFMLCESEKGWINKYSHKELQPYQEK